MPSPAPTLARILTPLIKFRACRDARRVTGDAMEIRGGCGYIEEWPDARLLRDSHLGSIWEGTSNIVALDVMRAITREDALPPLVEHLEAKTSDPSLLNALRRAAAFAERVAREGDEPLARQAASGLYHATTAIALAWEAEQANLPHRRALSNLVLLHRLTPRDPLAAPDDQRLIDEALANEGVR